MIYTVTLNPAIDKTVTVPDLSVGEVNRVVSVREDAGGKGINVSKCLKVLGTDSVAVTLLAGNGGQQLLELMNREKLAVLWEPAEGQTRTNLKIIDPVAGQNTDINEPGHRVTEEILQTLLDRLCEKVTAGDIAVLSGSLPKGAPANTYRVWTERLHTLGVRVLLDADGACMTEGLKACPDLIKPNETELSRLLERPLQTEEMLLAAGKDLIGAGIPRVVISMGGNGALFLLPEKSYRVKSLSVPVQSTVGAGDSMVAAMAYGLERNLPETEMICLAMAMGAASVMQSGSQAPAADLVDRLAEQAADGISQI